MARSRRTVAGMVAGLVVGCLGAGTLGLAAATPAAASGYASVAVATTFSVDLRGNGHGHGLSQYGAQGAAQAGLPYRKILAFYYPHTTLRTLASSSIRVLISHPGNAVTFAAQPGLRVSGIGQPLSTRGVSRFRLVSGRRRGVGLLAYRKGHWQPLRYGLPATTRIHRHGPVRVYVGGGSSTDYRQSILAVRRSARGNTGLLTVNRLAIDNYVAGVVPREMPASWDRAALQAQAVAVRSYARYEADHNPGNPYDICDTSSCQVYGGARHYAPNGNLLWSEDQHAVAGDRNQYLTYGGSAILAQFSASNGGWTVNGGTPYLVARRDPYDSSAAAGDPYALYHETIRSADVAAYFGLAKLTDIAILKRDGHGTWGGRVVTAKIIGRTASGATKKVRTDGADLQWAMGVGTDWLRLTPDHAPRGHLGSVRRGRHAVWVTGWALDTDHAANSPRVRINLDGRVAAVLRTHVRRPRVVHHFALAYHRPGFHARYRAGRGRHRVCVAVLDSNGRRPTHLGCATVRIRRR